MSILLATTLLTIEDEYTVRQSIVAYFEDNGLTVVQAADGKEGLDLFHRTHPDIVLTDLRLPVLDGLETIAALHVASPDTPIIVVSGTGKMQDAIDAIRLGAWDYVSKPIVDMADLELTVQRALERARLIRENRLYQAHLQDLVHERTVELQRVNEQLQFELTERKRADEELRKAKDLLDKTFASLNDAVFVIESGTRTILLCNSATRRIFGYTEEELIGHNTARLHVNQEMYVNFSKLLAPALRETDRFDGEFQMRRKDGTVFPTENSVVAIKDALGNRTALVSVVRDITARKQAEAQIQALNTELLAAYDATLEGWSLALELRDRETEGHSKRVIEMAVQLARALGMNEADVVHLRRGAILHDIGKMGVPDQILLKPGSLTEEEWHIMRLHPVFAYEMLSKIPFLKRALDIPYCHHEKWNGTGYPQGLAGEQIPLAARIFAIVDVWDAVRNDRPYRKGWSKQTAIEYMRAEAGKHFDPKLVEIFLTQPIDAE